MSAPKVLHIITRMDAGGSATNTRISVERLSEHGFEVELLYGVTADPGATLYRSLSQRGVRVHVVPSLVRNPSPWNDLRAWRAMVVVLRRGRYDLVHTHTSKAGVLGRLAARVCGIPAVHTPHGHVFYGYFNRMTTAFYVMLERIMAHMCRHMISLTDDETKAALARGIGRRRQYVTIPSGVPLRHFLRPADWDSAAFRAQYHIPPAATIFVSVGRLVPIKGYDVLLEAFGALARAHDVNQPLCLVIVGDGSERTKLEAQARQCAPSGSVVFAGEQSDVRPALWSADVFALASRNEGMGRAYVEALAAGLPAVGTNVGGVAHVVRHGVTGLLTPAGDAFQLADAMRRMVCNQALRHAAAGAAPGSVYPAYDEDTMVNALAELYRSVLIPGSGR